MPRRNGRSSKKTSPTAWAQARLQRIGTHGTMQTSLSLNIGIGAHPLIPIRSSKTMEARIIMLVGVEGQKEKANVAKGRAKDYQMMGNISPQKASEKASR